MAATEKPTKAGPASPLSGAVLADAHWAQTMERLRGRSLPHRTLRICDDDQARAQFDRAKEAADRAALLTDANPDNAELAEQSATLASACEAARAAFEAASLSLTFRALPRPVLKELIHAHPPTEQQSTDGAAFNPETLPSALIAAASVDGISDTEARELLDAWSAPDANALWEAAWSVQQESHIDLGKD